MKLNPTTHRWTDDDKRMLADLAEAYHLPRAAMLRKLIRDAHAEYQRQTQHNGKVTV